MLFDHHETQEQLTIRILSAAFEDHDAMVLACRMLDIREAKRVMQVAEMMATPVEGEKTWIVAVAAAYILASLHRKYDPRHIGIQEDNRSREHT